MVVKGIKKKMMIRKITGKGRGSKGMVRASLTPKVPN